MSFSLQNDLRRNILVFANPLMVWNPSYSFVRALKYMLTMKDLLKANVLFNEKMKQGLFFTNVPSSDGAWKHCCM